ncbi:MAG: pantoate--beta-alanine ligase [Rhodothermaceae bacterium]
MLIFRTVEEMQQYSEEQRCFGKKIGFVPTMGFLHDGHLSLVEKANQVADITIVSIFVNPTQFAPDEDLGNYPRDFERDETLLKEKNVDAIFYPTADEIYPKGYQTYVNVEEISKQYEGASRPTHFRGVTTIVSILFNAVKPHFAVFGQKDAQQASVIRKMVENLKYGIEIIVEPIKREEDGLAMSSRNVYLSKEQREESIILNRTLLAVEKTVKEGEINLDTIYKLVENKVGEIKTGRLDYFSIVEQDSFNEPEHLEENKKYFALIAVFFDSTRLLDNLIIIT